MRREAELFKAVLSRTTGKKYPRLSELLDTQENPELLRELQELAHDLDDSLAQARKDGNRDAWVRGKMR